MGCCVNLLDFGIDGDLDIFLLQGHPAAGSNRLLRNDSGRFTGVIVPADLEHFTYGMGAATADFKNDASVDLLTTGFGGNRLYRNNGNATFTDVTAQSPEIALSNRWSTSASFFDYDNDRWHDLIILKYVDYHFASDKRCLVPTVKLDYCTTCTNRSVPARLLHNDKGDFTDVTAKSGIDKATGPG